MAEPIRTGTRAPTSAQRATSVQPTEPANLADILERVLDKGIVIAGDIQVNLLDIELLTIKLRLVVASVERAREMGIDWWEHDPSLSSAASRTELASENTDSDGRRAVSGAGGQRELAEENRRLRERVEALEDAQERTEPLTDRREFGEDDG